MSDRERRTATVVGIGCIIAGLLFLVAMAAIAYRPKVVQGEEVCLAEPEDVKPAQPRAVAAEAYTYSDQAVLDNSSDYFIEKMARPEPGYHRLAGLWAFGNKGRRASQSELRDMLETALRTAQDPAKPFQQRFQCVYAVSGFEQPWLVPPLAEMLESDPNSKLRGVLACALGHFDDPAADEALREALRSESDPAVRSWIERALAGEFPRPTSPMPAD